MVIAVNPDIETIVSLAITTKVVLIVEYDGTRYYGFQLQASLPTIQGEIEKALEKLTGDKTRVIAASRTDTGVHASGQVVSFRTRSSYSLQTFVKGVNYYLPRDIAVKSAYRVRDSFNVRHNAISREYNYYILNGSIRSPLRDGFSYLVSGHMDIDTMNQACQALPGEHDFASFASSMGIGLKSTVRRIYRAEVRKEGELAVFNIIASSFLPHQVRNTIGALVRVGLGKMSVDEFCSIMRAKRPGMAGPTAPACGLCLMQVNYPHSLEEEI
ncbi:MAG: tRNA pseudouridine(38-40) synthase TruA [Dehalococcoidales bacterium]|nr:tRNA pseudouridine(38-40) synthase TruA [Dehalococcoidales bacterium]